MIESSSMANIRRIESRRELGDSYLLEMQELIDGGEIGSDVARRILEDMFEPALQGERPALKESAWRAYLDGRHRLRLVDRIRKEP
jgi:hypothetical protein